MILRLKRRYFNKMIIDGVLDSFKDNFLLFDLAELYGIINSL